MGRLEGKVALVTGGARGQGAAEARAFVAEGADVVLTDVRDEEGEELAAELGAHARYLHHDVTSEPEWADTVAEARGWRGHLDVLVNNAGVFAIIAMAATTLEEYLRIVTVNQVGTFLGMRSVADVMAEQRSGSIVNISSVAGLTGSAGTIAYSASKFAVRGMTKVAAVELAGVGVRVNSVHPGLIDTPMLHEAVARFDGVRVEGLAGGVPLGRLATAEDVVPLVVFLASDESVYCTGAEFVVDGGMTAKL